MKKKLSILVTLLLVMIMSVSTALAVYESSGGIVLPGGSFSVHNEISNNKKDSFARTSGPTNAYISVAVTFYYIDTVTGNTFSSSQSSSAWVPSIRKDAPTLGSDYNYYKVKSVHTGSIDDDSGSITLTTTA